jgi:hypothetical protein
MDHATLLNIHVVAGALGLVLGPPAMWLDTRSLRAGRGPAGGVSAAYPWTVLVVSLSAVVLVARYRADLWWLVPVAAVSYGLAVAGRLAAARRVRGWTHGYVHGLGGSYIALVSALLVVSLTVNGPLDGPAALLPWLAPTAVGVVVIEWWRRRLLPTRPAAEVDAWRERPRAARTGSGG